MCMVTDPGNGIPTVRESGPFAESGRGLNVVESCCVRWGWHLLDGGGKVVWALHASGRLSPGTDPGRRYLFAVPAVRAWRGLGKGGMRR